MRAWWWVLGLAACTARPLPVPGGPAHARGIDLPPVNGLDPARFATAVKDNGLSGVVPPDLPIGGRLDDDPEARLLAHLPFSRPPALPSEPSPLAAILNDVTHASFDPNRGQALESALAEVPASRYATYGVGALTFDQVITQGLCEEPQLDWTFTENGVAYEGALQVGSFIDIVGEPVADMYPLSASCETGLRTYEGDIDTAFAAGACNDGEVYDWFGETERNACGACVEAEHGDFDACQDAGACPQQVLAHAWVMEDDQKVWYPIGFGTMWACAPDATMTVAFLADIADDGTMPPAFDHAAWGYLCVPFWDEDQQAETWSCLSGVNGPKQGDALGEGETAYVEYIRPVGSDPDKEPWHGRSYYARSFVLENGLTLRWAWQWTPGEGMVSLPSWNPDTNGDGVLDLGDENFGYTYGGWGMNPYGTRPDGESQARDYLAFSTIKGSTTRNGILVSMYNHARCDAWDGPDATGAYRCTAPTLPASGWHEDAFVGSTDSTYVQSYAVPLATIASTGLPDPDVPGGIVMHVAGSDAEANPDWDDCRWPHRFVADRTPFQDWPDRWDTVGGALWGDTYKFGKDPYQDIRAVLSTDWARRYCAADGTGETWRTYENVQWDTSTEVVPLENE